MRNKHTKSLQLFWWLISYNVAQLLLWVMNAKCKWASECMKEEVSVTINYVTKFLLTPTILSESLWLIYLLSKKDCRGERTFSAPVTCFNCWHRLLNDYHRGNSHPKRKISCEDIYKRLLLLRFQPLFSWYLSDIKFLLHKDGYNFAIIQAPKKTL